jgi:hypothetical protein
MVTVRATSKAMQTAQRIAESEQIDPAQKEALMRQVLDAGATYSSTCRCDNWTQRAVAMSIGGIGALLALFVGVKMLQGGAIDPAVTSALTAAIGGLAGMFAQRAMGGDGDASKRQQLDPEVPNEQSVPLR